MDPGAATQKLLPEDGAATQAQGEEEPKNGCKKLLTRRNFAIAVVVAAAVGLGVYVLWGHMRAWLKVLTAWVQSLGIWAVPLWLILCWVVTAISGPAVCFEMTGGAVFDTMWGPTKGAIVAMLTCSCGVWLGCVTAFWLGRRYLKPKVEHLIQEHAFLATINKIVQKEGWTFAFLMRLNPLIPFEIFNYAIAMSDLTPVHNAISCLGTLPLVCFEVYSAVSAAEVAKGFAGSGEGAGSKLIATLVKFGISLVLIVIVGLYGKRKYDMEVASDASVSQAPQRRLSRASSFEAPLMPALVSSCGREQHADSA